MTIEYRKYDKEHQTEETIDYKGIKCICEVTNTMANLKPVLEFVKMLNL